MSKFLIGSLAIKKLITEDCRLFSTSNTFNSIGLHDLAGHFDTNILSIILDIIDPDGNIDGAEATVVYYETISMNLVHGETKCADVVYNTILGLIPVDV